MDPAPDTNLEAKKPGPAPASIPQLANCSRAKARPATRWKGTPLRAN